MLWWGHHGDTIEQPCFIPSKALTFTWLIFPKTMSDNQRVSGWSVLCFRTPTITTPVRRCIKPRTAGAFLFFFLRFPYYFPTKKSAADFFQHWIRSFFFKITSGIVQGRFGSALGKQHENRKNHHWMVATVVVMAKYPTRDLQAPNQVRCFAKKHGYLDNILSNPEQSRRLSDSPQRLPESSRKLFRCHFFCWNIQQKKHISAHIWSNYVKLLNTETMWYPSLGVLDVWISHAIISPDIVRCFSFSVVVLGCVSSNKKVEKFLFKVCSTKSIRMRTSYWSNVMKQQVQVGVKCPKSQSQPLTTEMLQTLAA